MRLSLIWLLALSLQAGTAVAAPQLEAWPIWQGLAKVGHSSEVQLRLANYPAGTTRIAVITASHRFEHTVELEADAPLQLQLPFVADISAMLAVEVTSADGTLSRQELKLQLIEAARPLRVSAVRAPPQQYLETAPALLHIASNSLPHTALGYGGVTAMVMDSATLNQLLPEQRRALREFVAACGQLYLLSTSSAQTLELQRYAGCGAKTVSAFTAWQQTSNPAVQAPWSPGTINALARLGATNTPKHPAIFPVSLLLAGYLLGLLLLLGFTAQRRWLLGWILLITALALGGWWQRPPLRTTLSWSEMQINDPVAQTTNILTLSGRGRWRGELNLAEATTAARSISANDAITSIVLRDSGMALQLTTHLLSRQQLSYQHNRFLDPELELGVRASRPFLVNHGGTSLSAAILWWNQEFFAIPPLAPGARWQMVDDTSISGARPLLQMMHQRLENAPLALLINRSDDSANSDWLLLRGIETVAGQKP